LHLFRSRAAAAASAEVRKYLSQFLGNLLIRSSYVHSLLTRLDRLKSVRSAVAEPQNDLNDPTTPAYESIIPAELQTPGTSSHLAEPSFDKHFMVKNANPTCWQYFGSSSVFALAVEVLVHARAKLGPVTHHENYAEFRLNRPVGEHPPSVRETPDRAVIEKLVSIYMASSNTLRGFIDEDAIVHDIEGYLTCHSTDTRQLVSYRAHQFFRISMICAIACANKARHHPSYSAESMQYYSEALRCVEEVTSELSVESLIALLLLILFSMFYPRKGDLWKLLDFACRLSVELGYHTEQDAGFADEKSRVRRRRIFWGLYCIERSIGQHFGRPSDLPEEIITTEYPAAIIPAHMADHASFQSAATSHYHRLVYLRSEISRELYLPAAAPNFPRHWYQQKYSTLLAWRQELPPSGSVSGVGTTTCDIAWQSTICFLFQPLLLRALANTKDNNWINEYSDTLPSESYQSACQLVEIYKQILRAPEDSTLGLHPLTIISALHIQTAAMTIMAFCLLAIDGRIPTAKWTLDGLEEELSSDGFDNIHDTSGSCLILLTKCAEKFPGMVGMLDIYKSLSQKIIPIMTRSGLA
jgi:Fungal specific transcription factor domain